MYKQQVLQTCLSYTIAIMKARQFLCLKKKSLVDTHSQGIWQAGRGFLLQYPQCQSNDLVQIDHFRQKVIQWNILMRQQYSCFSSVLFSCNLICFFILCLNRLDGTESPLLMHTVHVTSHLYCFFTLCPNSNLNPFNHLSFILVNGLPKWGRIKKKNGQKKKKRDKQRLTHTFFFKHVQDLKTKLFFW